MLSNLNIIRKIRKTLPNHNTKPLYDGVIVKSYILICLLDTRNGMVKNKSNFFLKITQGNYYCEGK